MTGIVVCEKASSVTDMLVQRYQWFIQKLSVINTVVTKHLQKADTQPKSISIQTPIGMLLVRESRQLYPWWRL